MQSSRTMPASIVPAVIVASFAASVTDATRQPTLRSCFRSSPRPTAKKKVTVRPSPVGILGECDEPPRQLIKGRMKYMVHQAVVDGRLHTVLATIIGEKR